MAEALVRLGIRHGMVVHGSDGLDEVTTTGPTDVLEVRGGRITAVRLEPDALGIPRATLAELRGGEAAANAALTRGILAGAPSPRRDIIVVNAGCAVYTADQAPTIREGMARAQEALESGRVLVLLERVKELSYAG
jgi:anthranilate phosphoribosyltransferase